MAYEHQLKLLADGFENTSADFATWADYLNLRIDYINNPPPPQPRHFATQRPAKTTPPKKVKAYRTIDLSLQDAAVSLGDIADCQVGIITNVYNGLGLNFVPSNPAAMPNTLNDFQFLNLILGWQQLDLGIFKTFMRHYGLVPSDFPPRPHPGPGSDERWGETIASWLNIIDLDVNSFVTLQKYNKGAATVVQQPANFTDVLTNLEQQYHRLVNNYLQLLTVLPYHVAAAQP